MPGLDKPPPGSTCYTPRLRAGSHLPTSFRTETGGPRTNPARLAIYEAGCIQDLRGERNELSFIPLSPTCIIPPHTHCPRARPHHDHLAQNPPCLSEYCCTRSFQSSRQSSSAHSHTCTLYTRTRSRTLGTRACLALGLWRDANCPTPVHDQRSSTTLARTPLQPLPSLLANRVLASGSGGQRQTDRSRAHSCQHSKTL
ncbi:hypothetical protein B0H13DRAFT_1053162 [Mycena leptocephala]|nr:hypothetical protein B0H13DRAFT_1053162 [Mycena leptocephala]